MNRFTLNKGTKFFLTLFFLVSVISSCKDKNQVVPYKYVNFSFSVFDPEYAALTVPGNSITVKGGVSGILIYRISETDFAAYDRTCTYEISDSCKVKVDDSGIFAVDSTCCYSEYLLLDGSVTKGPATYPLKRYNTSFDGTYLRVYN
ncbi:MAG: hypothetical protein K9H64_17260 [Bacteroidales bacterium]|nr:hypothetical protein [Bacteroidales bacterium]MCF8457709.1 hypothetical protein [Bacteroidales bacterium]